MVQVQPVDLSVFGVTLPSDRVGMVISQPHLSLTQEEPFRCTIDAKARQLQVVSDTLNVARTHAHGLAKTHFTIFPEYSIPGVDGIALIDSVLSELGWPVGTIVIGGCDALDKSQFVELCQRPGTHTEGVNSADIGNNQWINCAITWVKSQDGSIHRWLQPKLAPAGPERDVQFQSMFRGGSVFSFRGPLTNGTQYRFSSLVCFDWIAPFVGEAAWRRVLQGLAVEAHPNELSLSWFFVIQHNKKPSHTAFLEQVRNFFDQNISPSVHRHRSCLVFANTAGLAKPGRNREYGTTSLIFSAQSLFDKPTCPLTFSADGRRFRGTRLLDPFKQAVFREGGACVHSFAQINPSSLGIGPAGNAYAVESAYVFPLNDFADPRTPSDQVPACIKWLNDELDELDQADHQLGSRYADASLAPQINEAHATIVLAMRRLSAKSVASTIQLAAQGSGAQHADLWNGIEAQGLEHLIHTLSILGLAYGIPPIGTDPAHATATIRNQAVHVLATRGNTHEECMEHAKRFLPQRGSVLVVSRDTDNTHWLKVMGSYLQQESTQLDAERNITDPASGLLHLGYADLLHLFRSEPTVGALEGAINDQFDT